MHLNSLQLGFRAKATKTKGQRAEEEEERRRVNEMLRDCGYKNVRDNYSDLCGLFCGNCGREERHFEIRRCTGCEKVAYCSKSCQAKDWPLHRLSCDRVFDKAKEKREIAKATAIARFDAAIFKSFANAEESLTSDRNALVSLTPPVSGTIWGVVDPGLFGVIPLSDDDPLDYQLLNSHIQDFIESKSIFSIIEHLRVGELVIAKCEEEDAYARAVVARSYSSHRSSDALLDVKSLPQHGPAKDISVGATFGNLVDLWFVDVGVYQTHTSIDHLIPIRDFWDDLRRLEKSPLKGFVDAKYFVTMPARLIPCFLQAKDPDTGK